MGDIAVDSHEAPSRMAVRIRSSKTDKFGQGVTIIIGKGSATLCPVAAMLHYLAVCPDSTGPLFIDERNRHLTKQRFIAEVKEALALLGISSEAYKGIGAATTAAAGGVSETLIKDMGWWLSAAYQVYIRTPPAELAKVSAQLVSCSDI